MICSSDTIGYDKTYFSDSVLVYSGTKCHRRSTINELKKASTLNLNLPAGACCALPPGLSNQLTSSTLCSLFALFVIPQVCTPFLRKVREPMIIVKAGFSFWFWCRRAYTHLSITVPLCSDRSFNRLPSTTQSSGALPPLLRAPLF